MLKAATGDTLKSGAEFKFIAMRAPGGTETLLHMLVDGKGVGCVRSGALTASLFDTYIGAECVSPELRTAIANHFGKQ